MKADAPVSTVLLLTSPPSRTGERGGGGGRSGSVFTTGDGSPVSGEGRGRGAVFQ